MSEQADKIREELLKLKTQQKSLNKLHWLIGAVLLMTLVNRLWLTADSSGDSGIFVILCLCVGWLGTLTQSFHSSTTTLSNIMLEQLEEVI